MVRIAIHIYLEISSKENVLNGQILYLSE